MLAFNATQGFVYSTLAVEYDFSPVTVSVIATLPATAQVVQFFAPLIYKLIPSKRSAIFYLALVGRSSFWLIPLASVLDVKLGFIVALPFFLFNILNNIAGSLWTSAMRSLVPEHLRGSYFGFRNTVATFSGLVGWLFYSVMLQKLDRSTGLTVSYTFAALVFTLTAFLLKLHYIPETKVTELGVLAPLRTLRNRRFANFIAFVLLWNFAIQFAGPFFSYFEVSYLKVPYTFLGLVNLLNSALTMFFYPFYGRITQYFGEKNMIRFGITASLMIPFCYSLMTPANYKPLLLTTVFVSAVAWSAINLCYFNLLLKISEEPSELFVSMHSFVAGISSLASSYLGGVTFEALKDLRLGPLSAFNVMFALALALRLSALAFFVRLDLGQSIRDMRFVEVGYRIITRRY